MDPDEMLVTILDLCDDLKEEMQSRGIPNPEAVEKLVTRVLGFHDWLRTGRPLPRAWRKQD